MVLETKISDNKRRKSSIKFVGLHAHSVSGSPFDAIGYPQEHMDFSYFNGCDAVAITDHGNMNGLAYQVLYAKKMEKDGKDFKPIYGAELYYIDNIEEWKSEIERIREEKKKKEKEIKSSGTISEDGDDMKKQFKNILRQRCHLLLLVQNQEGLNNLFKMISESHKLENFYRFPRIDYKLLKKYNKGLLASSACVGGIFGQSVWKYKEDGDEAIYDDITKTAEVMLSIFGKERWYGELQWNNIPEQHKLNHMVIKVAKEKGFGIISTVDSHYPDPQSWKNREVYKRLGTLSQASKPDWLSKSIPKTINEIGYELYPKNGDQIWESYKKYSKEVGEEYDDEIILKSIEKTYEIAHNQIERFYPDNTVRLPNFVVPEGKTEDGALAELAIAGLRKMGLHEKPEYVKQLKEEIHIIQDRGFSKYFLTMKAISDKAQETQLVAPGRGSSAGSLTAYVLGITKIDPIKWDLQFSRFLRRDAKDYPDVDFDVEAPMELKERLIEEWGSDKVVPISNWNTLQLKSLIKDVSKLYGISWKETNEVTGVMMHEATPIAKKKHDIKSGLYVPTFEEVMEFSPTLQRYLEKYPFVEEHVVALYGQIRQLGRHAGGLLISEEADKYMPLINSGGIRQTPWTEGQNVRHLEPMGFIKFDILGLSSLRMINTCIRHILKRHMKIENPTFEDVKDFYNKNLHPDIIDLEDQKVYENVFHSGKWAGIFQFSERGAQGFCQRAKPTSIVDIATITSIYRPAPLSENVDQKYVLAKENLEDVEYINEKFKEATESTYGLLIFQEQIASLAHKLGKDISLDEGNTLRKLLVKKGIGENEEKKNKIYEKFIIGCKEKGISGTVAKKIWETFEYFSAYGFNKSHAISYSILSFQCAYLLTYYPSEWVAAYLDKESDKKKEKAINVARSLGFKIEPININKSSDVWEIDKDDDKTLIQPFTSILGIGEAAVEQLIKNRPYETLEDFFFNDNMLYNKVNKKCIDALIKSQALNLLIEKDENIKHMKHLWHIMCDGSKPNSKKQYYDKVKEYSNSEDFTDEEKIEHLVSLTGVFPIMMVVKEAVLNRIEERCVPQISEYEPELPIVWFIVREVIRRKTKNEKDYYVMKVIDANSTSETVKIWSVDPEKDLVFINHPYIAKLDYDEKWGFSARTTKNLKLIG